MLIDAELRLYFEQPADEDFPHAGVDVGVPGHEVVADEAVVFLAAGVALDVLDVGIDLGQDAQPVRGKGGFALGLGLFEVAELLQRVVGDVDSEHPRGTARLHVPRLAHTHLSKINSNILSHFLLAIKQIRHQWGRSVAALKIGRIIFKLNACEEGEGERQRG